MNTSNLQTISFCSPHLLIHFRLGPYSIFQFRFFFVSFWYFNFFQRLQIPAATKLLIPKKGVQFHGQNWCSWLRYSHYRGNHYFIEFIYCKLLTLKPSLIDWYINTEQEPSLLSNDEDNLPLRHLLSIYIIFEMFFLSISLHSPRTVSCLCI